MDVLKELETKFQDGQNFKYHKILIQTITTPYRIYKGAKQGAAFSQSISYQSIFAPLHFFQIDLYP